MGTTLQSVFQALGRFVSVVRDFLLGVMGLGCLALGILMAVIDKLPAAGTLFGAGIMLCLISSLSRFESSIGLWSESNMAALDSMLHEADNILAHIRNSVGLMADISFQTMARIGFWDATIPKSEALGIADAFQKQLKELGESDASVRRRMEPWLESNLRRLVAPIHQRLQDFIQLQNQILNDRAHSLPKPLDHASPEWQEITRLIDMNSAFLNRIGTQMANGMDIFLSKVEHFIDEAPTGTSEEKATFLSEIRPLIDDARYYAEQHDFRDREKWIESSY